MHLQYQFLRWNSLIWVLRGGHDWDDVHGTRWLSWMNRRDLLWPRIRWKIARSAQIPPLSKYNTWPFVMHWVCRPNATAYANPQNSINNDQLICLWVMIFPYTCKARLMTYVAQNWLTYVKSNNPSTNTKFEWHMGHIHLEDGMANRWLIVEWGQTFKVWWHTWHIHGEWPRLGWQTRY